VPQQERENKRSVIRSNTYPTLLAVTFGYRVQQTCMAMKTFDPGLKRAVKAAGSVHALARLLGISHNSILKWRRIPATRIVKIEQVTGIGRELLRPDLYRWMRRSRR